ncbi:HAMP domain-containing histidine kinase [Rhodobacter sp. KR11]|uniref:sensor histidine kinase n=1 Tax=Rhodobacter sp. KR11 TaxID=2974588 RepID=UPI00222266AA|nr:HAMP domain-containing sensor histidine kinase [Rhodobacter sp. KR11]MCW1920877.1 HAMP domain-containing histidine kinase [Rhodobacter sp. KR11]
MISSSMRFALAISAVFALAAVVAGGMSYILQAQDLQKRLEQDVAHTAQSLASTQDPQDLAELIAAIAATPDRAVVVEWQGADGTRLGNIQNPTRFEGARNISASGEGPDGYVAFGIQLGSGWLMVGRDDAWITESREVLLQTTAWGLGAALVLSVALALAVARRNEARIAHMQDVLLAVRAGNHAARIGARGSDDLDRVAQEVDQTLDRLEAGMAAIRQVSTDVAHDLRAPLSRLRLRLEPLPGPEIARAVEEIDSISATFDAILRLSRLQSRTVPLEAFPQDLAALMVEVAELFEPDTGHKLTLSLPKDRVIAPVDRELILQALVNLVQNALTHTPPCEITLSLRTEGDSAVLAVSDQGPGIPEADRARVLQRFVRLDGSRSSAGTGLGLAMVEAIASCHDGSVRLDDNNPGLKVEIRLPLPAG